MNQQGFCVRLRDRAGSITSGSSSWCFSAAVSAPLTGAVRIHGITGLDAAGWTLASGTSAGVHAAPGSGQNGGASVFYELEDEADAGKVTVIALPI